MKNVKCHECKYWLPDEDQCEYAGMPPCNEELDDRVVPTKLEVFNIGNTLSFDVNTPQFLKEACENANGGMYKTCWNVFRNLLMQVAERATELNDPILNTLMIRLNLYDIPNNERYKIIKLMKEEYDQLKS